MNKKFIIIDFSSFKIFFFFLSFNLFLFKINNFLLIEKLKKSKNYIILILI
jgi:hypothetical protein